MKTYSITNISKAAFDVFTERERQVVEEKWTPEHDDEYKLGELAKAGATYAMASTVSAEQARWRYLTTPAESLMSLLQRLWPWGNHLFEPVNPRRDLVRAAALLIAEIERIDRAEGRG